MKRLILPVLFAIVLSFMAFKEFSQTRPKCNEEKETNSIASNDGIVVLELFTSQGCSSCPPADVLMEKVKSNYPKNVFALSYHVDYWNYIGWEDPFSKKAYTVKQQEYNIKFKSKSNYTPQLVVNGKEHFVGSNSIKISDAIERYRDQEINNNILLRGRKEDEKIYFDFEINGELANKQLRAVLVLDERITKVERGENRNRTLKNSNIVIAEKYIEIPGNKGSDFIEIPSIVTNGEKLSIMLLIQDENLNINGAAKVELKS